MSETTRIIVFAKAPIAGFAKTRLAPVLGERGAAALAERLLQRTLAAALAADLGTVELCVTPGPNHAGWHGIDLPEGIAVTDQGEGDLGQRLAGAANRGLVEEARVLLTGTDCVEISPALLRRAAGALQRADAALYPTADGGYALLGLKRSDPSLFRDIPWSTQQVADMTLERIEALGWSLFRGEELHDIDRPEDLERLGELEPAGANLPALDIYGSKGRT